MNVTLALIWVAEIIIQVDALRVAKAVSKLGAGHSRADEPVDHKVGIRLLHVQV